MFHGMEYVYEVYRTRSFSKAAKNLFISQPSLSATIKKTEEKIGYPIFDRSTKPLGVTECGRAYIRAIEQILTIEREFETYIQDIGELKRGQLVLGGSNLFSSWVLPPLIGKFIHQYPGIQVELVEENTAKLAELLQNGDIDLVLDNCILDPGVFAYAVFLKEHLLLAVPREFPVNGKLKGYQIPVEQIREGAFLKKEVPCVPLHEFAEEPFILLKPENDTRQRAIRICDEQKFHPHVVFELDQQMTAYNITCSGMGISFISDTLIKSVPNHPEVIYYKLHESKAARDVSFYWKRGRYMSLAMKEFLKSTVGLEESDPGK